MPLTRNQNTISRGVRPPTLSSGIKQGNHQHVVKGTAYEVTGLTPGATVAIRGRDTSAWVGHDAPAAEANGLGGSAQEKFRFTLASAATSFFIDAATDGIYEWAEV